MTQVHYIAELTVYDPAIAGIRTLRYSTVGFATRPTESPPDTHYDERLLQPAVLRREMFSAGATQGRSRVGYGDLVLANGDGALDALVGYGFDGRPITIRRGDVGAVYPSGYTTVLVGTMAGVEVNFATITVKLRDRQAEVEIPLQTTKYAGDNALPDGLEGTPDDLQGKPKPLCFGKVVNVAPPCVNTAKLIYQLHDGELASVEMVYDRGQDLAFGLEFTNRTPIFANGINGIAYGAGVFVVVGDGGLLSTSPTGTGSWTARTSSFGSDNILGVTFANGIFVAVGALGKVATSSDGITWTQRTSNFGTDDIRTVAYGEGLFVAAGQNAATNNHHITSPDGTTWTARTNSFGSAAVWKVVYGFGQFVFVGDSGNVETSSDGLTTTARTSGVTNNLLGLTVGRDLYVAVGSNTGPVLLTSPDGITWTPQAHGFDTSNIQVAGYFGGTYFVAGSAGKVAVSTDGERWTRRTSSWASQARFAVGSGLGLVLLGGLGGNYDTSSVAGQAYASEADLLDDDLAPAPGTYKVYLTGGYFRLGAVPAGLITADVTQGAAASNRTAAQLWKAVLERVGLTSADYSAADATALDVANAAVLGYWTDQEVRASEVLDLIAQSVGAWWGVDRTGVFRIQQLTAPSGTPVLALVAGDLIPPFDRITPTDPGRGIPVYAVTVRWGRLGVVQGTDLAGAVTDVRRAYLAKEWREVRSLDASVQTAHPLAPELIMDTLLTTEADADAEADRVLALRSVLRDRYGFRIPLDEDSVTVDLGQVVSLTHDRFSLSAGKSFRVVVLEPDAAHHRLRLELWG
jgi:hypothetical protein